MMMMNCQASIFYYVMVAFKLSMGLGILMLIVLVSFLYFMYWSIFKAPYGPMIFFMDCLLGLLFLDIITVSFNPYEWDPGRMSAENFNCMVAVKGVRFYMYWFFLSVMAKVYLYLFVLCVLELISYFRPKKK